MTSKPSYPPRRKLAARPSTEMTSGTEQEPTALDRPLFVGEPDLGVPYTRERSIDRAEPPPELEEGAPPHTPLSWRLAAVLAVAAASAAGVAFGYWLAAGVGG